MARSYASKPNISNNSYPERKYIPGCACHAAGDFSFNTPWYFDRWKSPDITSLSLRSEHLSLPYRSGRVRSPQKGRLCSHYFKCFDGKDRLERQINTPDDQNRNRTVDIPCNFCEYNRPYNRIERSILQRVKAFSPASFLTPSNSRGLNLGYTDSSNSEILDRIPVAQPVADGRIRLIAPIAGCVRQADTVVHIGRYGRKFCSQAGLLRNGLRRPEGD